MRFVLCLIATLFVGCTFDRASLSPEAAATLDQLEREHATVLETLSEAKRVLMTDPSNPTFQQAVAVAEMAVQAAEKNLAEFETSVLRQRYGSFVTALSTIPVVGPWLTMLGPLGGALIPLLGKRGRKHYWNAVKKVNPFDAAGAGAPGAIPGTNISPVEALVDVLKALGIKHSSEASEAAAAE